MFHRQATGLFQKGRPDKFLRPTNKARPYSILLIPGIYERWSFIEPIAKILYDNGYDVHVVSDIGYNRGSIEEMAIKIFSYPSTRPDKRFVIVSHSKGGLIGKYLLAEPTLADKVAGLNDEDIEKLTAYL